MAAAENTMRTLLAILLTTTATATAYAGVEDPTALFEPAETDAEPDPIVERDCEATTPSSEEESLAPTNALSAKLEAARKRRAELVAIARPKLERLIDDAYRRGGKAVGPTATWIRVQFKYEPTAAFLAYLNGVLTLGSTDAETWIEPPAPRPDCSSHKHAVAERGGTKVWLCDPFYASSGDEGAKTLFHEALHLRDIGDCEYPFTGVTPREKRLCAANFEEMLDYLWRKAP
jgi:hypothetical protein